MQNNDIGFSIRGVTIRLLVTIAFVAILVGCSREIPIEEWIPAITDSDSCSAPCWNGIVLGETTRDEIDEILADLPPQNVSELTSYVAPIETIDEETLSWNDDQYLVRPRLIVTDSVASYMEFNPRLKGHYSLQSIIGAAGEPTKYRLIGEYFDNPHVILTLFYEESGVIIDIWFPVDTEVIVGIEERCELDLDSDSISDRLTIYLVVPTDSMQMAAPISPPLVASDEPILPWSSLEALSLTSC